MAGVPCVSDTCSIISSIDANGRLALNTHLSSTGGIHCIQGQGLAVNIVGTTGAAEPSACNSLLVLTSTGKLAAVRPTYRNFSVGALGPTAIPNNSTKTGTLSINNLANCQRLLIFTGEAFLQYTANAGPNIYGDFVLELIHNGTQVNSHTQTLVEPPGSGDFRAKAWSMQGFVSVNANDPITLQVKATLTNKAGNWDTTTGNNGIKFNIRGVIIDVGPRNDGLVSTFPTSLTIS